MGIRNALLGLIDNIPVIGSGISRDIEDHFPSRREREQAALIASQAAEISQLKRQLAEVDSYEGDRRQRQRERTARSLGRIDP